MSTYHFESTGEAYDACQCDEKIKDGDTLVIESERVVGLAWVWPIAISKEKGDLHGIKEGSSPESFFTGLSACERIFTDEAIAAARSTLAALGF